ncbi:hypothetical protein N7513_006586 [Penicillium frequentans]|nr:hypothetical protein N7513_006586 [Penicillium glabrum]
MHAVAQYGDEEMTKLLLSYDQVDANARDSDGETPLHYASSSGNIPFIRCMLESDKVVVNAKDASGRTPLHVAFLHNSPGVASLLLASDKVDPEEKDHNGLSAFDYKDLLQNLTVGHTPGMKAAFSARRVRELEDGGSSV